MNKNIPVLLAALAVSPLLSGCFTTLAMNGMNGIGACPAELVPLASTNAYVLNSVQPGDSIGALPEPQKKETIALRGGENTVEVWYYRTGHELCRNMPTVQPYTMVLIDTQRGSILGVGQQAVAAYRPYMERAPSHAPVDTGRSVLSDLSPFG